jgi:glycosyltransferase involved in cell wall biosynthesis
MPSLLISFHCESNTGYAIEPLERTFLELGRRLMQDDRRIHVAFTSLARGRPASFPESFGNILAFDPRDADPGSHARISEYVREHDIGFVFGFDLPVAAPGYAPLRSGGVRRIVSYQGAPMSSVNSGLKLFLKRLQMRTQRNGPDLFLFESKAMALTATHGRGVPAGRVALTYLGVDAMKYAPVDSRDDYLQRAFGIPPDRTVIYYSGHMEERKGVHVLVETAIDLADRRGRRDFHFLILGNRPGEELRFRQRLAGTAADAHVTFAGYRDDVAEILPRSDIGVIASTGWDSFTMSSLEIASCGLPLAASNLQGLAEAVEDGKTGRLFPPGDHAALAGIIERWIDNPGERRALGAAGRARILAGFTVESHLDRLTAACRRAFDLEAPGTRQPSSG